MIFQAAKLILTLISSAIVGWILRRSLPDNPNFAHIITGLFAIVLFAILITSPSQESKFHYPVRVKEEGTENGIKDAQVTIEVGELAPLNEVTDSDGYVRILIPASHIEQKGKLRVEANGYVPYNRGIDLYEGQLPNTISLQPSSDTSTPLVAGLRIRKVLNGNDFLIEGDIEGYKEGDRLVVYGRSDTGAELPIALLRVTAKNLDTLSAESILVHQNINYKIIANLRVDKHYDGFDDSNFIRPDQYTLPAATNASLSPTATPVLPTSVPPTPVLPTPVLPTSVLPTPVPLTPVSPTPISEPQSSTAISNQSILDRILTNGYFRGAIRKDLAKLSFIDENGRPAGFEADLLREIARRWFENENAFYEHAVIIDRADERKEIITSDQADMIASAFSYTEEREKVLDFSLIYFEDGQKLLVSITDEPPIKNICDLNGRSVGVISATTSINNIITKVVDNICGFTIQDGQLVRYATHREAVSALQNQGVAAVTTDSIILSGFENDILKVVGLAFSEEQYGIGLPNNDTELKNLVDLTLKAMKFDRTYDAIFCQWFPDRPIYPYEGINPDTLEPETKQRVTTDLEPLYTLPQDYNGKECDSLSPDVETPIPEDTPITYTVKTGDTLIGIALCHYGAVSFWRDIFIVNEEYIESLGGNNNLILPGWELRIPPVSGITKCIN